MFDRFLSECEGILEPILKGLGIEEPPSLEEPPGEFGDAAFPAFPLARVLKKAPQEIAREVAGKIAVPEDSLIEKVEAAGGYVNFHLDYGRMAPILLKEIVNKRDAFGSGGMEGSFTLEHTSANPDGPLHIGHGRNAIIGDSLARILRFAGCKVETQYYLNDMGKQLAVVVWLEHLELDREVKEDEAIGALYVEANRRMEESEEVRDEISQLMQAYEKGDEGVVERFKEAAEYCLRGQKETLERLGIRHDSITWESRFVRDGSVERTVERLKRTPCARTDDVLYLDLSEFGIEKELILQRSDGTYLYATRDIAHHIWRAKKGGIINVWGSDHKLLARQLSAVLRLLGEEVPEFVIYEFINLPEGSMSTRRGEFVSLDELVCETVERAYAEVDKRRPDEPEEFKREVAEKIGTAAVRYSIVRVSPDKAMTFRWEEALDFERQGSPFIQYAYARACRILEKEGAPGEFSVPELTREERELLKALSRFPVAVRDAARARKPAVVAHYCLELATAFHRFYMFQPVLKSREKDFRLNLVEATKLVLGTALGLLGVEALERM
ncbi:MAG: arginine--tRNA ligase [Euryarchaeota archaeon]|nr:arginine--tRNA ligase [Euryarchaeota archaeon]